MAVTTAMLEPKNSMDSAPQKKPTKAAIERARKMLEAEEQQREAEDKRRAELEEAKAIIEEANAEAAAEQKARDRFNAWLDGMAACDYSKEDHEAIERFAGANERRLKLFEIHKRALDHDFTTRLTEKDARHLEALAAKETEFEGFSKRRVYELAADTIRKAVQ